MRAQQRPSNALADLFALDEAVGTYRCALCRKTHRFGAGLASAEAEFETRFPGQDIEDSAIVCDPCYRGLGIGTN